MAAKTVPLEKLSNPLPTIYALHYGTRSTPFALVKPDEKWGERGMYRVHWPNGSVSDMVNLSRAKDAARLIAPTALPRMQLTSFPHSAMIVASMSKRLTNGSWCVTKSGHVLPASHMTPPKSSVSAASNQRGSGENCFLVFAP
jgi:hypothetical protein